MATGTVVRHMYTMYKDLIEAAFGKSGLDQTLSQNIGYAVQAHHCLSCSVLQDMQGGDMRRLAEESNYDVNRGSNGIALPAYFGHTRKHNLQRHRGGHWEDYYTAVREKLDPIYDKYKDTKPCKDPEARKNILGDLTTAEGEIKGKLEAPSLWLYAWSESLYNGDYRDEGATNLASPRDREGSSSAGTEWLNAGHTVKRRHQVVNGLPVLLSDWYSKKYGYPVPGGPTS
jgi:A nuclease family of the HNH/ENDO VII superfamily with conserved AHH